MDIKKRKALIIICLALLSVLLLCACQQSEENPPQETSQTITVTDCVGRSVEVPKNAQSIAAMDPFAGQCVIMFGQGEHIKATVGGVQRDLLLQAMCPQLKDSIVAMSGGTANAEQLLSLNTDLMFVKGDVYDNDSEREKLDKTGIPYLVIRYDDMESQMQAFLVLGRALGAEEEAQKVVSFYQKAIDTVSQTVADIPQSKRPTLYHSVNEAVRTDIANSICADWIALTGVTNVSLGKDLIMEEKNYYATLEQIFVWDPDLIICNESGVDDYILSDEKWAGLRAVREKRVYQIPIGVSRWGHFNSVETPLAIYWLAKLVYPQEFAGLDLEAQVKSFYHDFFDYDLDESTIEQILAGEGLRPPGVEAATQS